MNDYRAKRLKEAVRLCDVNPLSGEGLARYHVDLTPARKTEAIEDVNTVLDFQDPGQFSAILFTGQCGLSSEVELYDDLYGADFSSLFA